MVCIWLIFFLFQVVSVTSKLKPDVFKGVLSSMAVLPLNRLLLLGADSGNISLLA